MGWRQGSVARARFRLDDSLTRSRNRLRPAMPFSYCASDHGRRNAVFTAGAALGTDVDFDDCRLGRGGIAGDDADGELEGIVEAVATFGRKRGSTDCGIVGNGAAARAPRMGGCESGATAVECPVGCGRMATLEPIPVPLYPCGKGYIGDLPGGGTGRGGGIARGVAGDDIEGRVLCISGTRPEPIRSTVSSWCCPFAV